MAKAPTTTTEITVPEIATEALRVTIIGTSPLLMNRMAAKAQHELLLPRGRLSQADKDSRTKHDPIAEFQQSPNTIGDDTAPTYIAVMAAGFKKAMASAALDLPGGVRKAQIGRLCWIEGPPLLGVYGHPYLHMSIVRMSDIGRTPDVRTRAIMPAWCCDLTVRYVRPNLNQQAIVNLLSAAGLTQGVGEWRPEKGSGNFGQFRIARDADAELIASLRTEGRAAQQAAMANPEAYDDEAAELLAWYDTEIKRRGVKVA